MKVKIHLLETDTMQIVREYGSIEECLEDLKYKAPESFYVGIEGMPQAMTISDFIMIHGK